MLIENTKYKIVLESILSSPFPWPQHRSHRFWTEEHCVSPGPPPPQSSLVPGYTPLWLPTACRLKSKHGPSLYLQSCLPLPHPTALCTWATHGTQHHRPGCAGPRQARLPAEYWVRCVHHLIQSSQRDAVGRATCYPRSQGRKMKPRSHSGGPSPRSAAPALLPRSLSPGAQQLLQHPAYPAVSFQLRPGCPSLVRPLFTPSDNSVSGVPVTLHTFLIRKVPHYITFQPTN